MTFDPSFYRDEKRDGGIEKEVLIFFMISVTYSKVRTVILYSKCPIWERRRSNYFPDPRLQDCSSTPVVWIKRQGKLVLKKLGKLLKKELWLNSIPNLNIPLCKDS